MSDEKSGSDDLDAMLEQLEAEADSEGGSGGGGDVSDDDMAELEKMLADSPSPSKEAAEKKKKSGETPSLAADLEEAELEGLNFDDMPEDEGDAADEELPDDVAPKVDESAKTEAGESEETPASPQVDDSAEAQKQKRQVQEPSEPEQQPVQDPSETQPNETKKETEESTAESTDKQTGGGAPSWIGPAVLSTLKWTAYTLPSLILFWTLGAFLSRWITAGWLVGAVSLFVAVGVPVLVYDLAGRRGLKRWWFAGSGLVLSALLIAPVPQSAGGAFAYHGHWPGEMVEEFGLGEDNVVVGATSALGRSVGGWLGVTGPSSAELYPLGVAPGAQKSNDEKTQKSEKKQNGGKAEKSKKSEEKSAR